MFILLDMFSTGVGAEVNNQPEDGSCTGDPITPGVLRRIPR